jgi:hypothetical protein
MPWVRFDDRHPSHRQIRKLDDAAYRLHHSAICWSSGEGTDGVVEVDDLHLVSDVKQPSDSVEQLVRLGLWEVRNGGWFIVDYFDHCPSSDQIDAARQAKTARQQRWREKHRAADGTFGVDADVDASVDASRDTAPVPSRPVPSPTSYGSRKEDSSPRKRGGQPDEAFEAFWKIYPRKVAKAAAVKAWSKAVRDGTEPSTIIAAAQFYALERKMQDPVYTKHPATWLNAGCWQDEPDPAYTPPPRPSTTTAAVNQGMDLIERMAAQEGIDLSTLLPSLNPRELT